MKKAESRTGNKKQNRGGGFTLIEVLLAVSVISMGVVFILPTFFKSMNVLAYLSDRFEADLWADNLLVEAEEVLKKDHRLEDWPVVGKEAKGDQVYSYQA